jgi:hypothetical protein
LELGLGNSICKSEGNYINTETNTLGQELEDGGSRRRLQKGGWRRPEIAGPTVNECRRLPILRNGVSRSPKWHWTIISGPSK